MDLSRGDLAPRTRLPIGGAVIEVTDQSHTGCARFSSPLGVQDFIKTSSVLSYSEERLQCEGPAIIRFAEEEKLFAHAESVRVRMKDSN